MILTGVAAGERAVCSVCATTVATAPFTWATERDPQRGAVRICERCSRQHVRDMEARLDRTWW